MDQRTDTRRRAEESPAPPPAPTAYKQLLNEVRELLGPEHSALLERLDEAVFAWGNEWADYELLQPQTRFERHLVARVELLEERLPGEADR